MTIVTFGPYSFDTDALRGRGFLTPYVINGVTYELETAMRVAAALDIAAKAAATTGAASAVAADRDAVTQDREAVHQDRLAAEAAAAAAQTWDPTNYVRIVNGAITVPGISLTGIGFNHAPTSGNAYYWMDVSASVPETEYSLLEHIKPVDAGNQSSYILRFWEAAGGTYREVVYDAKTKVFNLFSGLGAFIAASIGALDGSTLTLGGGQTGATPTQAQVAETTHATSKRASFGIGSVWRLMSDTQGNGTRDFGLYSTTLAQFILKVAVNGVVSFVKAVVTPPINLGNVSGTVTLDLSLGNRFDMTLVGPTVLANPINGSPGQVVVLNAKQDGTGGRTMSCGTYFKTKSGAGISLSTAANARDKVVLEQYSSTEIDAAVSKDWK